MRILHLSSYYQTSVRNLCCLISICFIVLHSVKCQGRPCDEGMFMCHNGLCVSSTSYCDGKIDCDDSTDERFCDTFLKNNCDINYFPCLNGDCIPITWICNGEDDCGDYSDERECESIEIHNRTCKSYQFQCDNKECIPVRFKCNGRIDCDDESDENEMLCHGHRNSSSHGLAVSESGSSSMWIFGTVVLLFLENPLFI